MKVTVTVELELPDDFDPGTEAEWNAQIYEGICVYALDAHFYNSHLYADDMTSQTYHSTWMKALQRSQWKFSYEP